MGYDVVALGELLIDFTSAEGSGEAPVFTANPGGAPCNVLAMLAKLGRSTAFVGKVGEDLFGRFLKGAIERAGIYSGGLLLDGDPAAHTTLAFVQNAPDGDRAFSFYRDPGPMNCCGRRNCPGNCWKAPGCFISAPSPLPGSLPGPPPAERWSWPAERGLSSASTPTCGPLCGGSWIRAGRRCCGGVRSVMS